MREHEDGGDTILTVDRAVLQAEIQDGETASPIQGGKTRPQGVA